MSYWSAEFDKTIVGKNVNAVYVNEDTLWFDTDRGPVVYSVEGDCCSRSYFHDVVGADKLISNGPVIKVESVDLQPSDPGYHDPDCEGYWTGEGPKCGGRHEVLEVYGYRFVTEHPKWGEQSTVVAFRNDSNGYYGGWMFDVEDPTRPDDLTRVVDVWQAEE